MLACCEELSAEFESRNIIFKFDTEAGTVVEVHRKKHNQERTETISGFGVTIQWKGSSMGQGAGYEDTHGSAPPIEYMKSF